MGWLCRWKTKHGIKFKKAHGEKKDADVTEAETCSSTVLAQLLEEYPPRDIYNADEAAWYLLSCYTIWYSVFFY